MSIPLRTVLGELASAPGVSRLNVPRLARGRARARGAVRRRRRRDHQLTRGNTFYVTEILAVGSGTLPETVHDAVLARAASLGPGARRLLDVAALVPGKVEPRSSRRLHRTSSTSSTAALAPGSSARTERRLRSATSWRDSRSRAPCRRADGDASTPSSSEDCRRGCPQPGPGAPRPPRRTGRRRRSGARVRAEAARRAASAAAHREAAQQYARALRFAGGLPERDRADLLDLFALEAQLTGLSAEAADAWQEAIELYRAVGDRVAEGRGLAWLTRACVPIGRNAEAEAASRSAIEVLESIEPGPDLARAYAAQAYVRMLNRDNADGVVWGKRSAALAERLGDVDTLAYALTMIGTSYLMAGEIEMGVQYLERSLTIGREHGLWLWVGPTLSMLGSGLGEMYELDLSERYLHEHIAHTDEHDLWPHYSRAWLSLVEAYTGRWDEATATAQDVLAKASDSISRISALIAVGRVRARRGDPGAGEALDEALELSFPAATCSGSGTCERRVPRRRGWSVTRSALPRRHALRTHSRSRSDICGSPAELPFWQRQAGVLDSWPEWVAEPYRLQLAGSSMGVCGSLERAQLPLRGSAGAVGCGRGAAASRGALGARTPGSSPGGTDGPTEAAEPRRVRTPRSPPLDPVEPGRADGTRARRAPARRRREAERGDRRRPRAFAAHDRPPRVGDPPQAGGANEGRGDRRRDRSRLSRRVTRGRRGCDTAVAGAGRKPALGSLLPPDDGGPGTIEHRAWCRVDAEARSEPNESTHGPSMSVDT